MRIKIAEEIIKLYEKNHLDTEVSLDWILGYIRDEYLEQIPWNLIDFNLESYQLINVEIATLERIKIDNEINYEKVINFLLMKAFLLGGNE